MAYKSIFEEGEIKPATTPKASTGYVSIFDDEEKKLEPIITQSVPVKINPLVPEVKSTSVTDYLFKELSPKTTTTVSNRYVQDPTRSNVSIPFEKAPLKTQIENLTPEELRKMKTSELYELKRVAGMEEGDAKQWYSSFMAGVGDVVDIIGSTMKWQGAEGGLIDRIGENLQEVGKATQSKYTDYEALEKIGEFDWADMAKPSFWQNKVPRLIPFSLSLIPAALIGGVVGTTIGASFGLGALVTTITGAIGGAVLNRPLEGMMEAGSTYDEAIAKGFSEEKAQEAANEVFIENLKQMSVLDVIQMIPLLKGIKGFKIPNSTVNKIVNIAGTGTAIVSEGFEEVLQNKIVSDALGEKFDLASPETKESFVLGTIMGGVFQGTGGIVNISQRAITNATKENLSKKNQAIFEKSLDKFMKEGETRSDSEVLALNEVAKIDQKGLQDAITKTLDEKSQELKDAGIEQQASTVLKEETPADKLAKQIKKSDPIDRLLATIEEQEVETKVEEPLVQEARKYKSAEEFVNVIKIRHRPPDADGGKPLNDLEEMFPNIYSPQGDRYYASYGMAGEKQAMQVIREMKDKPDEEITIYRSINPDEKSTINAGDWVTIVKDYAKQHGESNLDEGFKIISKKVKSSDILNDGNSIVEWGYRPEGHKDFTRSELKDIWNKAQEKPTAKQAPTIKKPTTKKKVKEVKPTEKEISKSVESIISLPRKEAIQKLQESIKENGFFKGGEEILNKVATPTLNRGIDLEVFKRKPSILNLVKENVFTDSFILINDKEIAKKLYKEVKDKTGVEENKSEPAIEWKQVVPEKWGNNEAYIIGYENLGRDRFNQFELMVRLTDGETNTYVDANKLAFIKKQLPNSKMYLSGQRTPVVFIERGKVKGLLMPISISKDYTAKYQEQRVIGLKSEKAEGLDELPMFQEYILSGIEVAKEAEEMGSDQGGLSDYTLDQIKSEDYSIKEISIEELRKSDPDLDDYLKIAEIREYEGEPFAMYPIVSSKGEVLDGYNRIAQLVAYDKKTVTVFYGVKKGQPKFQELSNEDALIQEAKKYKSAEEFVDRGYKYKERIDNLIKYSQENKYASWEVPKYFGETFSFPENNPKIEDEIKRIVGEKGKDYFYIHSFYPEKLRGTGFVRDEFLTELKMMKSEYKNLFGENSHSRKYFATSSFTDEAEHFFDKLEIEGYLKRLTSTSKSYEGFNKMVLGKSEKRNNAELPDSWLNVFEITDKIDNFLPRMTRKDFFKNAIRGNVGVKEIYKKLGIKTKSQLTDIWNKANETKYQELGESTKLPDIQLKKDVITKDMQGNKITLKEGEVFSVYELPKNRYLLEGKESYTVPKNQFQNIKGQSIVAEKKEFAPELDGTEETVKGAEKARTSKGEQSFKMYNKPYDDLTTAQRNNIDKFTQEQNIDRTKFEQYTLPNGENYREILIKAKKDPTIRLEWTEEKNGEYNTDYRGKKLTIIPEGKKFYVYEKDGQLGRTADSLEKAKQIAENYAIGKIKTGFKSSHWDEPNVLFHLRMNDRTYNGNKVSFMEEFQSDWAREGRDKGFSKNLPKGTENDIEIKFVKSNVPEGHDPKNYSGYYEAFDKRTGDFLGRGGTKPDLMERALEEINLTKGVPYNPLLKNWQVTSIKRALIESVDSDYFAWTNGEQQKARYNLSDKVDNIEWFTKNKEKGISIRLLNKKSVDIYIDENGKIIKSDKKDWKGENLQNVIGKGLSEKIMEKDDGMLSGIDLDVGGEWANSLYDVQAKKIVEQLTGGKVEMIDMGLGTGKETPSFEIPKHGYVTSYTELTPENIEKGIKIRKTGIDGDEYIITDVLGDGKFKAIPKSEYDFIKESVQKGSSEELKLENARNSRQNETFDISQKTTLQPALKLTPEIKAIIRSEAPQLKVEQKLYQTPSQGSQVLVETIQRITTQEAFDQAQDFAIVRDTNIPIKAVETIIENPRAFGKYQKGTIEFIYNPDITTIPHEIGHYWFEAMLTKDQQTEVLREYKEWFIKNKPNKARPNTRNGWEEAMVQDMAKYYSKKYTKKKGKIERFWDWFIYQIKRVLNKNDFIARFTYDVRTKSIDRNVSKRKLADSLNQTGAIRTNGGIIIPDETKGQAFRRKIQDINTRIDTTVTTLRGSGIDIPESQDIFLAKTLLPRRIGGAIEKFANEVMNPLINAMAKDGVDLDNLNLYLHAMHAPERNRKMNELRKAENDKRNRQRVNPKPYFPVDGLSGMTDAEARSVINTFKEMGIASKLEEHRISLRKIIKATLLFQLKEELLSQEEYDAIWGSYENYVPLGRDIEDNAKGWGTGKGVNVKGKEIKRARGSQDLPVLPIVSQIFNRMNTAIVRAEKNRVALSVARLIKANPKIKTKTGKDLWTIKSEKYIPRYDSFGEVEYAEPLGARSQKPNEIAFKYKGKQKYLVINDPLLVRALTDEGKSKPIPYLTRYTSLLSRLATQYNPEFLIRNFSRDISESLVNVSGIAENYLTKEDTKGLKSDILKSIPKLFGAIYGYKSRKESHDAKDLIDEFIKNGGEVGYFWLEDEKTLDQKFKRQWRKSAPKGFSDKAKNQMSDFMDFVGNVNSTVELVTRVAVYKALRERGISAKQSAQIAGDITVDFNKKGEWGALISSMYMFFNAAVQGAARVFRSIKSSKKVRVMAASLFIGGFLNGIISQLWGDGDDEDYDQFIPDYKKNTRIVFADPTGKEWTVFFLPYGFGFFWAAGRSFSEVVRGKKDILESSVNVTRAFVQSFLPIDVMGGWKEFVPSSVKPLVEVATNEAWYDAPIAPDQPAYQPKIPESQRYFKTASNMSKSLSTWLNSVTGGDENRSGIVDISPEFIDYLWQQYTSGAGSFIGNVAETGYGAIKGDIKKERVPFVRSFAADIKKESVIKSNVYDIIDEGARRLFDQAKKDKFYKQVDWLIKNGSLSEDEQENIDKGNELKINFLKAQYNFTLGDKISIVEALEKMSEKDVNIFFESLTPRQIKSIRTGK